MAQKTAEVIELLQYTTTVSELRLFLGLFIVYRRFVPNFAKLVSPLNKKLKKGETLRFELDDKGRKTVDALKEKLTTLAVLALYRLNGKYTPDKEACDTQAECVLLQEPEDKVLKPTGYWSRLLYDAGTRMILLSRSVWH